MMAAAENDHPRDGSLAYWESKISNVVSSHRSEERTAMCASARSSWTGSLSQ